MTEILKTWKDQIIKEVQEKDAQQDRRIHTLETKNAHLQNYIATILATAQRNSDKFDEQTRINDNTTDTINDINQKHDQTEEDIDDMTENLNHLEKLTKA